MELERAEPLKGATPPKGGLATLPTTPPPLGGSARCSPGTQTPMKKQRRQESWHQVGVEVSLLLQCMTNMLWWM